MCTVVAAVILSFSVVITGKISSPATFYSTTGGIVAAFISVFWSFGYIRLSDRLRKTASEPSKVCNRKQFWCSLELDFRIQMYNVFVSIVYCEFRCEENAR